ncbi:MAG: hypothetical protein QOI95_2339 [Acidimicrobiaceae bacterium]
MSVGVRLWPVHGAAETRYATTPDGTHIGYQVVGDGALDLLELPYGTTFSVDAIEDEPHWSRFEERLASFSRLIRFDFRGVGLSDPFPPASPPSLEDWMQDAVAVLDDIGSERAALFGVSSGGEVALLLAATFPDRVSAVVVVNSFARVLEAADYPQGYAAEFVDAFRSEIVKPARDDDRLDDVAFIAPSLQHDDAFRRWWKKAGSRGASPALALALFVPVMEGDIRAVLPSIQAPTLVVHRAGNRFVPVSFGRYLADHIPDARYVELPGDDHVPYAGDQDAIVDEIEEFLTGNRHEPDANRVLATVVFTDIVGSTDLAAAMGDRRWKDLLDEHDRAVRRQLERFRGREIKTIGDAFLITFDGPGRAIQCAAAIRDATKALGIDVRAGVHTGEIELRGDDIAGMAVHIGARVAALADAGEILVSSAVPPLVAGSNITFIERGEHDLKGVPGKWHLLAADL